MSHSHAIGFSVLLLATACARQVGNMTVTGAQVVATPAPPVTAAEAVALRLADELCAREAACNHIGEGARYRSEEACLSDQSARAPAQMATWTCTPPQTQGTFEECLAAIRSERCETPLARVDELAACRSAPVCGH